MNEIWPAQIDTPYEDVWIEMKLLAISWHISVVASYVGAWIEIADRLPLLSSYVDAWIGICWVLLQGLLLAVTSCEDVWIENYVGRGVEGCILCECMNRNDDGSGAKLPAMLHPMRMYESKCGPLKPHFRATLRKGNKRKIGLFSAVDDGSTIHPMWVHESKYRHPQHLRNRPGVASYVDVWIETIPLISSKKWIEMKMYLHCGTLHPIQMRESK